MLAFVAAVGAELSSGESVLAQLKMEPTGVAAVMVRPTNWWPSCGRRRVRLES